MSARDIFHNSVRVALQKDGWTITHDPRAVKVNELDFYVDIEAERVLAAQKAGQKIAVEIKSILGTSEVSEFYVALGQTLTYRSAFKDIAFFKENKTSIKPIIIKFLTRIYK